MATTHGLAPQLASRASRRARHASPLTRLAFLGSPDVAASTLRALHAAGHDVAVVVTGPDRRRGRNAPPSPTPVKQAAAELRIPVSERVADVPAYGVELGVVVAFGKLVRPEVLEQVPMLNVHFSLLPRWRGAAPVERAILAGDHETGVSVMGLEEGLDTGPVYAREVVQIDPDETAGQLRDRLGELGTRLLLGLLAGGPDGLGTPEPQAGEATYAAKVTADELEIDWARSAEACHRVVRVGRAWSTFRHRRIAVRSARVVAPGPEPGDGPGRGAAGSALAPGTLVEGRVATGDGVLELLEVQAEGRSVQPYVAWALGARPEHGERLGG